MATMTLYHNSTISETTRRYARAAAHCVTFVATWASRSPSPGTVSNARLAHVDFATRGTPADAMKDWIGTAEGQRVFDQVMDPKSPVGKSKADSLELPAVSLDEIRRRRAAR